MSPCRSPSTPQAAGGSHRSGARACRIIELTMTIEPHTAVAPLSAADETATALRGSGLFGACSAAEIAKLAHSCRVETIAAGAILLREGHEPDDVYLLLAGLPD